MSRSDRILRDINTRLHRRRLAAWWRQVAYARAGRANSATGARDAVHQF